MTTILKRIDIGPARVIPKGVYDTTASYEYMNMVSYDGELWQLISNDYVIGDLPIEGDTPGISTSGRWARIGGGRGRDGIDGAQGPQGIQGVQGPEGPIGPQGPQGPKGDTGATGATGETGPQGPKGDTGTAPAHEWDGTSLRWKNPDGTWAAYANLIGPQGVQGPQGIEGPQGLTGPQGETGPQGPKGETGPKGDTGPQGPKGDKGDTGPQGPKGDTGAAGATGAYSATAHALVMADASGGLSGWSQAIADAAISKITDVPDNIIGVELMGTGNGAGRWRRIDKNAKTVMPQPGYFATHPLYSRMTLSQVDGQAMINIPKFYFLHKRVDGKDRWWIAPSAFTIDGSAASVHKGFIYNNIEKDSFQVGAFECSTDASDSTKTASKGGAAPLVSIDFPTMVTRCNNRNTGTVTGFALWNIYQLAAIQMLCLIEMGSPDSQNVIGAGNVSWGCGDEGCVCGSTNAVWRGIYELWGNVWHMTQGLKNWSGTYRLWADAGNETFATTGITVPSTGYPTEFSNEAASIGLFLPVATSRAAEAGITSDYFYSNNDEVDVLFHGGSRSYGASGGVFCLRVDAHAYVASNHVGGRLARVG